VPRSFLPAHNLFSHSPSLDMLFPRLAGLVLAAATLLGQSVAADAGTKCTKLSVRREWRSMPPHERADWISAVKCLNTLPHNSSLVPTLNTTFAAIPPINTSSSYFDDWVYVHMDLNRIIHFTGQFLPWHRAYVKDFETTLQEKCGYKGTQPYWDWRLDANANFGNSSFWDPDPNSGVGGWGDPNNDWQITTGGFATGFPLSYPAPHRLRRQYTPIEPGAPFPLVDSFTFESQDIMLHGSVGNLIGFQTVIESGSHAAVHAIVAGEFSGSCPANAVGCIPGPKWPPNDPLFFMHHAMIDKLWDEWQSLNPASFWSYGGGSVSLNQGFQADPTFPTGGPPFLDLGSPIPTDGILNEYTVFELMHTKNERLCYVYE